MLNKSALEVLKKIRSAAVGQQTVGLSDALIEPFLLTDSRLAQAIDAAELAYDSMRKEHPALFQLDEAALIEKLQRRFLNFYPATAICPFVPLTAQGPWIVTSHGAVMYDTGGYGMLGFGHNPDGLKEVLGSNYVMANIMTPSFSQFRFTEKLEEFIGICRTPSKNPYQRFVCMNSGSEAMSVATRVSDLNAKVMSDPGGQHAGKKIMLLSLEGSFHGRTGRPARASDSTKRTYQQMASFRDLQNLLTVPANDIAALKDLFKQVEKDNVFIECMMMEPVMGEGNPGLAITPEFYKVARQLTMDHGSFLLVDSIQAGLRCHGVLSIVDYPGFESLEAPDMETFSKALNAGQFPLSVLALNARAARAYKAGVYGNTKTANPRGLELGIEVLNRFDESVRNNIKERGQELLAGLEALKNEMPDVILKVQGTGLLVCAELAKDYPVLGPDNVEKAVRLQGVNVIHGGKNALRFTPNLDISSQEIGLILAVLKSVLKGYK